MVSGYALGFTTQTHWDAVSSKIDTANHAWNQAYVQGRWVNIDTTWASRNPYEDGQFVYGGMENHLYFDVSQVVISLNHKHLSYRK